MPATWPPILSRQRVLMSIYKWGAQLSSTGTVQANVTRSQRNGLTKSVRPFLCERVMGLEPTTLTLGRFYSTIELHPQICSKYILGGALCQIDWNFCLCGAIPVLAIEVQRLDLGCDNLAIFTRCGQAFK